jgi:N-methylhydantoinase A
VLDIIEVGTGGGSIAWRDDGGALHVGPRSAGAEPGPVCYGSGGTEPTITDANVVLGRLAPDRFLGGEMMLDRDAAVSALQEKLAGPLDVTLERAASGILEIAVNSMGDAVRGVTLEQGLDPRDFTLVAYGGGGPLHAGAVARELQIERIIIPQAPGHFSALGMLMADLRRDFVQTLFERLNEIDIEALESEFVKLEEEGRAALAETGIATHDVVFERSADMRYVGQEHSVAVKMPARIEGDGARAQLKQLFDDAHEARYSHHAPDEPCDVVTLRVTAIGRTSKPPLPEIASGDSTPPGIAGVGTRAMFFEGRGELTCRVFERAKLLAGNRIDGPAAIEDTASVTILGPNDSAEVDRFGLLHISVGDL